MSRTIIRYPGSTPRYVGPFGDEAIAREWFAEYGGGGRVRYIPLKAPFPAPKGLPLIPRRISLGPTKGGFTRVDELADSQGEWFVLGPEAALPIDQEVLVWQRAGDEHVPVIIDYYVAERTVRHRDGDGELGEPTRWVLAAFTNVRRGQVCDD